MFRPLPLYIGLHYTRAKRRNHFVSFISLTSVFGLALGVMVLITALSIWSGFERTLRDRILGMTAHVSIYGGPARDWRSTAQALGKQPEIAGVAPFLWLEAMLVRSGKVQGALIDGILPEEEPKVSILAERMQQGRLSDLVPGKDGIILGYALAEALGAGLGDRLTVVVPHARPERRDGILPAFLQLTVAGIFRMDMHEYDAKIALVHLEDALDAFGSTGGRFGLRLKIADVIAAPRISQEVLRALPAGYRATDWTQQHVNFFRALASQKTMMSVILTLIIAVAAFNIVSMLFMVVKDKEADIAILKTLGFTPGGVMAIFMVQGTVIGLVGTLLGVLSGAWLASHITTIAPTLEAMLQTKLFPPDIYYLSELPSEVRWSDILGTGLTAFALSILATLYPSWRAARSQPAETLRHE
ncbi:MAG: lipoprotein-releasing ABC transporter permease subunit [Gammaproteobacteria bacterium]